ncbi:MAG TPA: type II CAAX endopeptidase family protein [Gemmatimonadales bacterium]|nr:type II CAAX endopeptidase family protein [Gemmatimonadales bacterium]
MTSAPPSRPAHPVRRAVLGILGFAFLGFFLFGLIAAPFAPHIDTQGSIEELARRPTIALLLLQGIGLLIGFGLATWLVGIKGFKLSLRDLRWRVSMGWARGLAAGLALGILPAAAAMVLGAVLGASAWVPDSGSLPDYISRVGLLVLLLAPAALAEEIIFRGVPLVLLAGAIGRPAAIVGLSLLFAFFHITNPDVTAQALGNIALAGILLSLAFYSPGGIWAAFGAHAGWNLTLASLGAPVSGLPFEIPVIDYTIGRPGWLTGGGFGPEGGLLSTLTLTSAVILAVRWVSKSLK